MTINTFGDLLHSAAYSLDTRTANGWQSRPCARMTSL